MNFKDIQNIAGLQIIPVNDKKIPLVKNWQNSTEKHDLSNCKGIGLVCGAISGNVEVIDIDLKYDITGKLYDNFRKLINDTDKTVLPLMVVQKTISGGYHFIYRCSEIEGNKKLANRYTTQSEKEIDKNEKIKVLIETRGTGGYIVLSPTNGYSMVYGQLDKINEITPEQRRVIIDCATTFNEVFDEPVIKNEIKNNFDNEPNPFKEYDETGDIVSVLTDNGWTIVKEIGDKIRLLRPGGKGNWSADWHKELRKFYVFTSSTDFNINTAYNASTVLCTVKFNGNFSDCAKWLKQNGYGAKIEIVAKNPIIIEDNIVPFSVDEKNILAVRNGTFELGLKSNWETFDKYYRFKKGNFVCVNGHANIGKTVTLSYLMVLTAVLYNWRWIVYSSENRTWSVRKKLMEFSNGIEITRMSDAEYNKAKDFVMSMFTFINIDRLYSAEELIDVASALNDKDSYNGFLVDPYNSLRMDLTKNDKYSSHEYHYEVASKFRIFANSNGVTTYLNCHAITESLRRKDKDGYPVAPFAEDTEGGGKFVNRADDFITLHRLIQHPLDYRNTQVHIRKIKDVETGGRPTPFAEPIILTMSVGNCGFYDENNYNPVLGKYEKSIKPENEYNFYENNNEEPPF